MRIANTMTTIDPPPGHEILTADFLRTFGAVEGLKWRVKDNIWPQWHDNDIAERVARPDTLEFCAPIGTAARHVIASDGTKLRVLTEEECEARENDKGLWWKYRKDGDWTSCDADRRAAYDVSEWKCEKPPMSYAIPLAQPPEAQAAQPTAEEMPSDGGFIEWLEQFIKDGGWIHKPYGSYGWTVGKIKIMGDGKTLRLAITAAIKEARP